MPRQLEPEILDSLRPEDPEAHGNRRDLRIINGLMGNPVQQSSRLHQMQRTT